MKAYKKQGRPKKEVPLLPYNPVGWFETVSGQGLSATTGAGSTTGIQIVYVEV
jgi:hypothetical protein